MSDLLEPKTLTVYEFMKTGDYACLKAVPRYQRGYAWDHERQVFDLLHDIDAAKSRNANSYFIGAMLCIRRDKDGKAVHEIVDGQQRLTTLSLIFAAMCHYVDENDAALKGKISVSPERFKEHLMSFLFHGEDELLDDTSLSKRPYLLELGDSDNMQYRQIVQDGPTTQGSAKHRRFNDAYNTILTFLKDKVEEFGAKYLGEFATFLTKKVRIVVIFISDEADAYEIFEVLNARNMHLTAIDLIKNKLLSCFSGDKEDLDHAYEQWRTAFIACRERPTHMQDYVRCHLQMQAGEKVEPKILYHHLRTVVDGSNRKQKAKGILDDLEKHCHKFSAMICKDDRFWERDGFQADIKPVVGYLNDYRVVYTVMFSMLYAVKPPEFVFSAYKILEMFMKRTRAVRDRLSIMDHYEQELAKVARDIKKGKGPKNVATFFAEIKRIDASGWLVIPDQNFVRQMSERTRIKDAHAKTILTELSNYWQSKQCQATQVDSGNATLEHILPRNPQYRQWAKFQNEDFASLYVDRIGNLTLLEGTKNTSASNKSFAEKKRRAYEPCGILLTSDLCDVPEWTPEEVDKRSKRLAELAAEVWSFDFVK